MIQKIKSKKGFTLAELLIVVAIIGVLVAIAIPVFTSQLNNAKEAVDDANLRSATSMAVVEYLTANPTGGTASTNYNVFSKDPQVGKTTNIKVSTEATLTGYKTFVGQLDGHGKMIVTIGAGGVVEKSEWATK